MSTLKRRPDSTELHSPKRLRGGGLDDDFVDEGELFDDELIQDQQEEQIPADVINQLLPHDLSETMKSKWSRPPVKLKGPDEDLSFQWLDIDIIGGKPLTQNPNVSNDVVGSKTGQVPILRVYGVTEEGNSVAAFLHGFTPYCFFAVPSDVEVDGSESTLSKIRQLLNTKLQANARGMDKSMDMVHKVTYYEDFKSIMGYESPHKKFLKVHVAMPTLVPTLKRIMESGVRLPGMNYDQEFAAFECNVPFVLRFMIDCDISGAGWLTLPKNTFSIRRVSPQTHCQASIDC